MSEQHYIFLASSDGLNYHPNNSPFDFTIETSKPLNLVGKWECALIDFNCRTFSTHDFLSFDVLCDLCEFSIDGTVLIQSQSSEEFTCQKLSSLTSLFHTTFQ